ncbi:MAG: SRPBCC family protein, partial [Chloroflexi bacterium]|nr:SRPBCC family protein [Chloroflexota bacterium]
MAHAEFQVTINRSVKDVFNFVLDGDNNPKWRPVCVSIQRLTNQPDAVGTIFKQISQSPAGRIDCDYEITECVPNKSIQFKVIAGPARPTGTYKLVSAGNATTIT